MTLGKLLSLLGIDPFSAKLEGKKRDRTNIYDIAVYISHQSLLTASLRVWGKAFNPVLRTYSEAVCFLQFALCRANANAVHPIL